MENERKTEINERKTETNERKTCKKCGYSGCYFETVTKIEKKSMPPIAIITKKYIGLKCPKCSFEFDFMEMK